jgi:hypothetical protein
MFHALVALLGGIGEVLAMFTMGRFLGDVVARITDDFKRNRATVRRLKQAAADENLRAPLSRPSDGRP